MIIVGKFDKSTKLGIISDLTPDTNYVFRLTNFTRFLSFSSTTLKVRTKPKHQSIHHLTKVLNDCKEWNIRHSCMVKKYLENQIYVGVNENSTLKRKLRNKNIETKCIQDYFGFTPKQSENILGLKDGKLNTTSRILEMNICKKIHCFLLQWPTLLKCFVLSLTTSHLYVYFKYLCYIFYNLSMAWWKQNDKNEEILQMAISLNNGHIVNYTTKISENQLLSKLQDLINQQREIEHLVFAKQESIINLKMDLETMRWKLLNSCEHEMKVIINKKTMLSAKVAQIKQANAYKEQCLDLHKQALKEWTPEVNKLKGQMNEGLSQDTSKRKESLEILEQQKKIESNNIALSQNDLGLIWVAKSHTSTKICEMYQIIKDCRSFTNQITGVIQKSFYDKQLAVESSINGTFKSSLIHLQTQNLQDENTWIQNQNKLFEKLSAIKKVTTDLGIDLKSNLTISKKNRKDMDSKLYVLLINLKKGNSKQETFLDSEVSDQEEVDIENTSGLFLNAITHRNKFLTKYDVEDDIDSDILELKERNDNLNQNNQLGAEDSKFTIKDEDVMRKNLIKSFLITKTDIKPENLEVGTAEGFLVKDPQSNASEESENLPEAGFFTKLFQGFKFSSPDVSTIKDKNSISDSLIGSLRQLSENFNPNKPTWNSLHQPRNSDSFDKSSQVEISKFSPGTGNYKNSIDIGLVSTSNNSEKRSQVHNNCTESFSGSSISPNSLWDESQQNWISPVELNRRIIQSSVTKFNTLGQHPQHHFSCQQSQNNAKITVNDGLSTILESFDSRSGPNGKMNRIMTRNQNFEETTRISTGELNYLQSIPLYNPAKNVSISSLNTNNSGLRETPSPKLYNLENGSSILNSSESLYRASTNDSSGSYISFTSPGLNQAAKLNNIPNSNNDYNGTNGAVDHSEDAIYPPVLLPNDLLRDLQE